jgi:hypothetical protein
MTVAATESGVAVLVEAREIILEFQGIIRRKALAELDTWISRARSSLVAAFANGVSKDKAAPSSRLRQSLFFLRSVSAAVLVGDEADHVFLIVDMSAVHGP